MTESRYTLIGRTADGRLIMQRGSAIRYCYPSDNPRPAPETKPPPKPPKPPRPVRPAICTGTHKSKTGAVYKFFYATFSIHGKKYRKQSTRIDTIERWLDEMKPLYENR